jgi:hypothetical protein
VISKNSAERTVCTRCSRAAVPLSDPPLCGKCRELERRRMRKEAEERPRTLREATCKGFHHA